MVKLSYFIYLSTTGRILDFYWGGVLQKNFTKHKKSIFVCILVTFLRVYKNFKGGGLKPGSPPSGYGLAGGTEIQVTEIYPSVWDSLRSKFG